MLARDAPHPFRSGTRFAETASRANQPYRPVAIRRQLFVARLKLPKITQFLPFSGLQPVQYGQAPRIGHVGQPGEAVRLIHGVAPFKRRCRRSWPVRSFGPLHPLAHDVELAVDAVDHGLFVLGAFLRLAAAECVAMRKKQA